jgi:hypothetical protein
VAADTVFGLTLQNFDFTVSSVNNGYGMQGNMSMKKQVKANQTIWWWGYSTQVNFKTALPANAIL